MAVTQGTLNKAYVSAIAFLDQRDINPNLIDQSRDRQFTNIMKLVGRYKPTIVPTYNYFVNNDVFATAVVSSVSSGYGTSIMTIVLTSAGGGYARKNDVVKISNANMAGREALVTNVTSVSGVDTLVLQSVDNTPLYAATNDIVSFPSNAFGEKSDAPANRRYPVTRYINQTQIFREVDEITDVQKAAKIEVTVDGQPYYTPINHIYKVDALNGFISAQMIVGVQSSTLFSDSNPILKDSSNNPIQTTMGLDQYVSTYGIADGAATPGTLLLTDVATMCDNFLANKAPHNQMGFLGSVARRPWDNLFKNLASSGVESVRMVIDGRQTDLMVDKVSVYNFEYELVPFELMDHPQLMPYSVNPEITGSVYWCPKDKVQVVGGGMEARLQIRYQPKVMAGGNSTSNGIITEWHTGALAPIPTSSLMVWHTDWYTCQGLEALGLKHFQRFRLV